MNERTARNRHALGAAGAALAALALAGAGIVAAVGGCEPQESQLTILLVEYKGPEAGPSAERLAEDLTQQNLPGVFVVEGHEYAAVCVGRYATWKDAAAKEMLGRVRRIRDARGQYPFAGVMLMPVPEPPPKTEWPIEEAPGLFSLYVAGWEGPGRKESAQAYASKLRRDRWEAYVYHGPRLSMVTIGAFGPDLFDDASKIGLPGATPEIVHPKALEILRAFPYLRIEDEVTPVRSTAIRIPGREDGGPAGPPIPSRLYRITLSLVSTQTGLSEGRGRVSGVAQHASEIGPLTEALVEQMLSAIGPDERARIGFLEVPAADADAADPDAGRRATEALAAALAGAAARNSRLVVLDPSATRQLLDADALTSDMVRGNARLLKGLTGLQYVVIGTATVSKT
jgi:hypothetical protein